MLAGMVVVRVFWFVGCWLSEICVQDVFWCVRGVFWLLVQKMRTCFQKMRTCSQKMRTFGLLVQKMRTWCEQRWVGINEMRTRCQQRWMGFNVWSISLGVCGKFLGAWGSCVWVVRTCGVLVWEPVGSSLEHRGPEGCPEPFAGVGYT